MRKLWNLMGVATAELRVLVPDVDTYGEYKHQRAKKYDQHSPLLFCHSVSSLSFVATRYVTKNATSPTVK